MTRAHLYGCRRGREGLAQKEAVTEIPRGKVGNVEGIIHEVLPDLRIRRFEERSPRVSNGYHGKKSCEMEMFDREMAA